MKEVITKRDRKNRLIKKVISFFLFIVLAALTLWGMHGI